MNFMSALGLSELTPSWDPHADSPTAHSTESKVSLCSFPVWMSVQVTCRAPEESLSTFFGTHFHANLVPYASMKSVTRPAICCIKKKTITTIKHAKNHYWCFKNTQTVVEKALPDQTPGGRCCEPSLWCLSQCLWGSLHTPVPHLRTPGWGSQYFYMDSGTRCVAITHNLNN